MKDSLPHYIDEPLMIAHLLGGANGVDFSKEISNEEIARRVAVAIAYGKEIRRQLSQSIPTNQLT
jgi:hypothetical protein